MPDIKSIQAELRAAGIDGWLFYDFRGRDPIANRILGLGAALSTRRWFYLVPARGTPRKLVHGIESRALDALPGTKTIYSAREQLQAGLRKLLAGAGTVAMQYSPRNAIPYVSLVDAGTVELVRSHGARVVSSADLVQQFEARWSAAQLASHRAAGRVIDRLIPQAFARAADFVRRGKRLSEYDLQQWMLERFAAGGLTTEDGPIVAVGPNSGDPHYEPRPRSSRPIRAGELLLLDVWGKLKRPGSVYYDVTWTGFLGTAVPRKLARIFGIVREARDAALHAADHALRQGRIIQGWQVDRAARSVIERAGYARYFLHRTGHSIGESVHGNGANMDSLETRDTRRLVPHTCFSVEPGIYLKEFGIRSEINVYVSERSAAATGPVQTELAPLLAPQPARRKNGRR
jgi:Xaa-Pro dipeptidase